MKQSNKVITAAVAIAAAAGLAITGAALASADTPTQAATSGSYGGVVPEGGAPGGMAGGPGGDPSRSMHPGETLLTGTVKDKVTAAAKAKEPGATVERVETDAEGVYEAHMVRADGTPIIVQVDKSIAVTAVRTGGLGGGRHGGPGTGPEAETGQQPQPDQSSESRQLGAATTGEGASST